MNDPFAFREQRVDATQKWGAGNFVLNTLTGKCTSVDSLQLLSDAKSNLQATDTGPSKSGPTLDF